MVVSVLGRWCDQPVPGPLKSVARERQEFGRGLEIPVCVGRVDVAQHGCEQRQLCLDVGAIAIPAQERAQHEGMADVVQPSSTPKCFSVKTGDVTPPIEPAPDRLPARSRSPAGEKERDWIRGMRTQLIARADVALKRDDGAGVKWDLARAAVLGVPNGEPPVTQLDI